MLEEEAKQKICPMSMARKRIPNSGNPGSYLDLDNCIGSGCMAWRKISAGVGRCGLAGEE